MSADSLAAGLAGVLRQGLVLLDRVDNATYAARLAVACDASIGAHYRHSLDHFRCLERALADGVVDYDLRERDPGLESDRERARAETERLLAAFAADRLPDAARAVTVRGRVCAADERVPEVVSTWGREWMYAVAHTIHHYALIGVLCRLQHADLPAAFGVAPSTLRHHAT